MPFLTTTLKLRLWDFLLANLVLVSTFVSAMLVAGLVSSFTENLIALSAIPLACATLVVTAAAVALRSDLSWERIGVSRGALAGLARGLGLGIGACGVLVLLTLALQWAAWEPIDAAALRFDWRDAQVTGVFLLAIGAAGEELFMRGLLLQFLARALSPAGAIAATSIGFALLHGANPGVTPLAQCNTAIFGAVFGVAVVRHRSLWLPTGLHFGWNIAQVGLGVNTSGITMRLTELNLDLRGAEWLTGGDYGFEGGLLATGMALALSASVWMLPVQRPAARMFWDAHGPANGKVPPALARSDSSRARDDVGTAGEGEV